MGPKPFSQETYIAKAIEKHGTRYIYNNTKYVNRRTKIIITCRIHGDFTTTPTGHLQGHGGCIKCSNISGIRKTGNYVTNKLHKTRKPSTFKTFIKNCRKYDNTYIDKARAVHKGKYLYLPINTTIHNIETFKLSIICKNHGKFEQTIKNHLHGQGCPECGRVLTSKALTKSFEYIEGKSVKIHGNLYTYYKDSYVNTQQHMDILCNTCNKVFKMSPDSHINQKQGCPFCRGMYRTYLDAEKALKNIDEDYQLQSTIDLNTKILSKTVIPFYCKTHGITERTFGDLLRGLGCRNCKTNGFSIVKPGVLYYASINNGTAYKIGITNYSVEKRFPAKDFSNLQVIKEWYFEDGHECYKQEQKILKEFKEFKYKGPNLLVNGNTEMFNKDILMLDTNFNH